MIEIDIYNAVIKNDVELVQKIIDQEPSILYLQDSFKRTPLHVACYRGYKEVAQLLIKAGADVHVKGQYGLTPLQLACRYNHLGVVELLINAGADICVKDESGWTPLHEACYYDREEIVQLLLHYRLDWLTVNKDNQTPVDVAIEEPLNDILVFLETIIDQLPKAERKKIQAFRFRQELTKTS